MRPITLFFILLLAISIPSGNAQNTNSKDKKDCYLITKIKEATFQSDLTNAYLLFYDKDGNVTDSIHTPSYVWNNDTIYVSQIAVPVSDVDSTYIFDVHSPGYEIQTVTWGVKAFGKRERYREMDPIILKRARELKELTVTGSKIKFYNKGDTIVYDASAFQLAEGSMLDALIAQLPGAKIDENGRITVNGEFVESLLLNGKEFFKNDNQVMLENIAAYTVKNIQVYKSQTKKEKWINDPTPPQQLTMDVKLKKEYSIGWIINAQGGYGTADRYLGRLFASWFSPRTTVSVIANANNLNDSRRPGKSDSWTPEQMPNGRMRTVNAGLNYNHNNTSETVNIDGNVNVRSSSVDNETSTSRVNFLSSGNTFDRSFSNSQAKSLYINTYHDIYYRNKSIAGGVGVSGLYSKNENQASAISGTFNREYEDMSRDALEAIYSSASPGVLESVINRSITRSNGDSHNSSISFSPFFSYTIPNTSDALQASFNISYSDSKFNQWNDYDINFGSDPNPAERRRQYTDNSPNYTFSLNGTVGYRWTLSRSLMMYLNYSYGFKKNESDSYMFALDRLDDIGVYGVLPDGYQTVLDPANSYTSSTYTNTHSLSPYITWFKEFDKSRFSIFAMPQLSIRHQHLDYWRENRSYLVKRTSFIVRNNSYRGLLSYDFSKSDDGSNHYANSLSYELNLDTSTPELLHLVDVVNDADPLNISVGNPDLKNALTQKHTLKWVYGPTGKPFNNQLSLSYEQISNALVRGYVYDTSTGVRRNKTYNVGGNNTCRVLDFINYEFGSHKQFTLASATDFSLMNNTDMIGIDREEPQKYAVRNLSLGEDLILTYRIGKQQISAQGTVSHRHTTSERESFADVNAQHYKYGVNGTFELPAGFGISTDFYLYKRVGYGVRELDTTDAVWNLRLTYTPRGSRWVFTADGFDLLHKLSNVHYAVTASGRTVSYTNTLPRYMIFTVQYRLNIQPKK